MFLTAISWIGIIFILIGWRLGKKDLIGCTFSSVGAGMVVVYCYSIEAWAVGLLNLIWFLLALKDIYTWAKSGETNGDP